MRAKAIALNILLFSEECEHPDAVDSRHRSFDDIGGRGMVRLVKEDELEVRFVGDRGVLERVIWVFRNISDPNLILQAAQWISSPTHGLQVIESLLGHPAKLASFLNQWRILIRSLDPSAQESAVETLDAVLAIARSKGRVPSLLSLLNFRRSIAGAPGQDVQDPEMRQAVEDYISRGFHSDLQRTRVNAHFLLGTLQEIANRVGISPDSLAWDGFFGRLSDSEFLSIFSDPLSIPNQIIFFLERHPSA